VRCQDKTEQDREEKDPGPDEAWDFADPVQPPLKNRTRTPRRRLWSNLNSEADSAGVSAEEWAEEWAEEQAVGEDEAVDEDEEWADPEGNRESDYWGRDQSRLHKMTVNREAQ